MKLRPVLSTQTPASCMQVQLAVSVIIVEGCGLIRGKIFMDWAKTMKTAKFKGLENLALYSSML